MFEVPGSLDRDRIRQLFSPQALQRDPGRVVAYWRTSIADNCRFRGVLQVNERELRREFVVEYRDEYGDNVRVPPSNLPEAVEELLATRELLIADRLLEELKTADAESAAADAASSPAAAAGAGIFGVLRWGAGLVRGVSDTLRAGAGGTGGAQQPGANETRGLVSVELLRELSRLVVASAQRQACGPEGAVLFTRLSGSSNKQAQDEEFSFRSFLRRVVCADADASAGATAATAAVSTPTAAHGLAAANSAEQQLKRVLLGLDETGALLLAAYMVQEGDAAEGVFDGAAVIKVLGPSAATATATAAAAGRRVSKLEASLLRLRASRANVDRQITEAERGMADSLSRAREYKARGNEPMALQMMHRRERGKARLASLTKSYCALDGALGRIETARDENDLNRTLLETYRNAASGLRELREDGGVTLERAAEALDAFEDELDKSRELADDVAARLGVGAGTGSGDAEEDERLLEEISKLSFGEKTAAAAVAAATPVAPAAPATPVAPSAQILALSEPISPDRPVVVSAHAAHTPSSADKIAQAAPALV